MSKIGRKPIDVSNIQVSISGQEITFKGSNGHGSYILPDELTATLEDKKLIITPREKHPSRNVKMIWGLARALLANKILGASVGFERQLQIVGLVFKAIPVGKRIEFNLGFSHKISFDLPDQVQLSVDKSGQVLTFKSADKELLGAVCDRIRSFRPPEPYKGTGIRLSTEKIIRKAGKTKSS